MVSAYMAIMMMTVTEVARILQATVRQLRLHQHLQLEQAWSCSSNSIVLSTLFLCLTLLHSDHINIDRRACHVNISQKSSDDYSVTIIISPLDAEAGEDVHLHKMTLVQGELLALIRVHEAHPQDLLSAGNEVPIP